MAWKQLLATDYEIEAETEEGNLVIKDEVDEETAKQRFLWMMRNGFKYITLTKHDPNTIGIPDDYQITANWD